MVYLSISKNIKIKLVLIAAIVLCIMSFTGIYATISTNLPVSKISDTFPDSYKTFINNLKKIYPKAQFKAVYTGLDWNTVVKHECYEVNKRISTIPSSYGAEWKMNGTNTYIDGYFVAASKSAVAYVLDPRNSLYKQYVFQFEGLTYNPNITNSVIQKVIAASPMVGTYEKKYKNNGKWVDMNMSYVDIINKVGKEKNVSSVYIASRMLQETSGDIVNNGSVNGSNKTYPGVYNFFNIKATPNADGTGAITNGLKYAKSQGWTDPYKSIAGGVEIIKSNYIKYGQDTVYFQKFDVNNPYSNATALLYWQYQTNIMAPRSESTISYSAYNKLGLLADTAFAFYIPVYNNMPEDPTPYPAGDKAKFEKDSTKVYLDDGIKNGTDVFNIRSSANSEIDNVIYTVSESKEGSSNRTVMTRTKRGNGYDWDYVEFTVGEKTIKGYVWKEYVRESNYVKVNEVKLDKNELKLEIDETYALVHTVLPTNAKYKNVEWSTSDDSVVSVENGKLTAKKLGTAIITVTTLDQEKRVSCNVEVVPKTPSITLDSDEYIIEIDDTFTPKVVLKNIAEYIIEVEDTNIVSVEGNTVKGIKLGETIIRIKGKDTDVVKEAKVIVDKDVIKYTFDESLKIKDNILTGILPNTIVSGLVEKIALKNADLVIKNSSNNVIKDTENVGTDSVVIISKKDGTELKKFKVTICGEVTGDGKINSADLLKVVKYLKGTASLNSTAADVTKDGNINSADLLRMVKYLKGTASIDFN